MGDQDILAGLMPWRARVHEAGFLAVIVALAALLVGTSVSSYRGDLALMEALVEGEGERLFHLLRDPGPGGPRGGPPPALELLIANQPALAPEGLRRVAVLGRGGELLAESGEPPTASAGLASGVVRIVRPLHPPPGSMPPPRGEGPPMRLVLEYEPRLALDLQHRARRDLIASLAVAAGLLMTAWVFHRLRRRAQQAEEGLAEQRHLAALGELSAVLAHEIRNPLASLKGHAQLLEEQLADDPRRYAKAHRVVDEAVRLERLTNSLLDFTRADRLTPGLAAPAEVARRAAELTEPGRVVVDASGAPERWSFDAMRIEQALVNLVGNALQASAPPAKVELKVWRRARGCASRWRTAGRGCRRRCGRGCSSRS